MGLGVPCRLVTSHGGNDRTGTRTQDQRIKSPAIDRRNSILAKHLENSLPPVGPHLATDICQTDSDLASVYEAWDRLPEAVRAGIVAMVRASAKRDGGR